MLLTRKLAKAMADEVQNEDAQFSLVILPTIQWVKNFTENKSLRDVWKKMSSFMCSGDFDCFDLMDSFQEIEYHKLDTACDGWHFGPRTNEILAEIMIESVLPSKETVN